MPSSSNTEYQEHKLASKSDKQMAAWTHNLHCSNPNHPPWTRPGMSRVRRPHPTKQTPRRRPQQRYIDGPDVNESSVITLDALSAAQAANDLMMLFTGLYQEDVNLGHQLHFVYERNL